MLPPLAHEPEVAFAHFTDPDRMREVFSGRISNLLSPGEEIADCTLWYANLKRYVKPSSRRKSHLSVCYRLTVRNQVGAATRHPILYGKAFLDGRSQREFGLHTRASASSPDQRPIHLPDLDLILWPFPQDPGLPQLRTLADSHTVIPHLPYEDFPNGLLRPEALRRVAIQIMHYRPECRCTLRYDLFGTPRGSAPTLTIVGKTFRDQGPVIYDRMRYLWEQANRSVDRFHIARPLEYDADLRTIWQTSVPGDSLRSRWRERGHPTHLDAVANGLAVIHRCDLDTPTTVTPEDHLTELEKKIEKLTQVCPTNARLLARLHARLRSTAPSGTAFAPSLIHGDFHVDQLLVERDRVVFFDFDEFAQGDPMQDLANFLVDLRFRQFPRAFFQEAVHRLTGEYEKAGAGPVSLERMEWHAGIQLVNKLHRLFIQRRPEFATALASITEYLDTGWFLPVTGRTRQVR